MRHTSDGDDAAFRAGVMRLQTVKDIDVLVGRLQAMRAQVADSPDTLDEVRALVHGCATTTGIWLDDLACRFADTEPFRLSCRCFTGR
ncbi:hypothetical protein [Streptomyces sp. 1222.5]|uniref:hypothetical protein n=1 Tax=Streptomyces sp. 1222.5 TaxID=1881026 RepID=UPI003EBE7EA9